MPPVYSQTPLSVNAAAKKYGIPQRTLARWAAQGKVKVLVHPERRGQKMLIDQASVLKAIQKQYNLPPFRYCPYCGHLLADQEEPDTR